MLRTRFTVAVAAAVAAVTLAITAVAFVVVRSDLQNQVRQELRTEAAAVYRQARHYHGHIPAGWVPPHSDRFGASSPYTQVLTAQGGVWAAAGDAGLLRADAEATAVAAGQRGSYDSDTTLDAVPAMVLTTPLAPGLALQVAAPLNTVDTEVASVGATLAVLSAIGIALAALAGWGVARAGLAPVARLAAVAEQVTATGDPANRVEVDRADELGRLAASFNTMLHALQRSLAAQRRLVSDASHELRTPLASLRINADVLLEHPEMPAAERNEVLTRVADQVEELSRLVVSVTDLARGEPLQRERSQIRFDAVTSDALDAARRDWPNTEFDADLAPCTVNGSADRLRVAVKNLLDNAAKFGPPEGPIEVRLADGALTVRDHGPGIEADDLPFIFDRFYRATSSRSAPGAGLGLAVVREIALGHGGMVTADAAPGGGTVMRFSLPGRHRPDQPAEGNVWTRRPDVMAANPGAGD